jgi:hypothetical protein
LGSVGSAANKVALKNVNVTHILTVAGKIAPAYPADFVYKVIDGKMIVVVVVVVVVVVSCIPCDVMIKKHMICIDAVLFFLILWLSKVMQVNSQCIRF